MKGKAWLHRFVAPPAWQSGWLLAVFAAVAQTMLLSVGFAMPNPEENLLVNPDAESGNTRGWIDPDNAWSAHDERAAQQGALFFWPQRRDIEQTSLFQDVDLSSHRHLIDSGQAHLQLSAWLANHDQHPHDQATLALEALGEGQTQLLYLSHSHRSPTWTRYQIDAPAPAGTRTVRVHLIATRYVGDDNDAYFDALGLSIGDQPPAAAVSITSDHGTRVAVGSTLQLVAASGGQDSGYLWSSSFPAVAAVDDNGLVTAHRPGRLTILAEGSSTQATGYLEIVAYAADDVIFTAPVAGGSVTAGNRSSIRWDPVGNVGAGTLFFSATNGSSWAEIAGISDLSAGQLDWSAPNAEHALNSCLLKMVWEGGESVSSTFSVTPPGAGRPDTGEGGILSVESGTVQAGGEASIELSLIDAAAVSRLAFSLGFDPTVVAIERIEPALQFSPPADFTAVPDGPGSMHIELSSPEPLQGDVTLALVVLQAIGAEGTSSDLKLLPRQAAGAAGQPLAVAPLWGSIAIAGESEIGNETSPGLLDALHALQMSVGLIEQDTSLDIDNDGQVTAEDARHLIRRSFDRGS